MIEFQKYLEIYDIDRSTLFRHIADRKVFQVKEGGKAYIVDEEETYINIQAKRKKEVINSIRESWNQLILQAHNAIGLDTEKAVRVQTIETILKEVNFWNKRGINIVGYNEKSIYRKIKQGKVQREQRADKYFYRNTVLKSEASQNKLLAVSWHLFGKPSACLNYRLMYDKVIDYASKHELFYELAALPKSTMIHFLKQEFTALGLDKAHQLLNHYNLYKQKKARNKGAFTKDIQFMDYIIGDDHKMDIDKVLVYDEVKKEFRKETVRGYFWIEGKTQKVLSYVLLPRELTAEDLKLSLMEALAEYGKPNKAVMIDNGAQGRSGAFIDFCNKAGVHIEYSVPYEPTNKANIERIFGYMKNEFDVYQDNYVGSNHPVEGRHRTSKLSAEDCKITFEQYEKQFASYVYGFFETRERRRVIDQKAINISIIDLFNHYKAHHEIKPVEDRVLRFALQSVKVLKYNNGLTFTMKKHVYDYMPDPNLSSVFNGKTVLVYYTPNDMNRVDIYAAAPILDKQTGATYEKNEYITRLESYELFSSSERRERIAHTNKKIDKRLKEVADLRVDAIIASTVDDTGKVVEERKRIKKQVLNEIKDSMPLKKITNIVVSASQVKQLDEAKRKQEPDEKIEVTADDFNELN